MVSTVCHSPITRPLTYSYSLLLKGIIYADLGTSPLYVLNGIWPADGPVPPEEDVIGGVSAIIWAIIILPLIKYVRLFLSKRNEDILIITRSLYALLSELQRVQSRLLKINGVALTSPQEKVAHSLYIRACSLQNISMQIPIVL